VDCAPGSPATVQSATITYNDIDNTLNLIGTGTSATAITAGSGKYILFLVVNNNYYHYNVCILSLNFILKEELIKNNNKKTPPVSPSLYNKLLGLSPLVGFMLRPFKRIYVLLLLVLSVLELYSEYRRVNY